MRLRLALIVAALPFAAAPQSADAQSFIENLAKRAVDRAASAVAAHVEQSAHTGTEPQTAEAASPETSLSEPPQVSVRSSGRKSTRPTPAGPAPWPLNVGDAAYTGDWEFDPVYEARRKALTEFSKVRCTGCEGGYSYDSWINHHLKDKDPDGVPAMIGRMTVGEALFWTGVEASGRLEVIGDASVGAFPCKQVKITMTRGMESAEALGLYCKGKTHQYDAAAWAEVL